MNTKISLLYNVVDVPLFIPAALPFIIGVALILLVIGGFAWVAVKIYSFIITLGQDGKPLDIDEQ